MAWQCTIFSFGDLYNDELYLQNNDGSPRYTDPEQILDRIDFLSSVVSRSLNEIDHLKRYKFKLLNLTSYENMED